MTASLYAWTAIAIVLSIGFFSTNTFAAEEHKVYPDAESVEPLKVGSAVPSAIVRSIDGEVVDLAKRIGDSGALLVFYRGGW